MNKTVTLLLFFLLAGTIATTAQSYSGGSGMVNAGYVWTPALSSSLSSLTGDSLVFNKGYSVIGVDLSYRNDRTIFTLSGYLGSQEGKFRDRDVIEPFFWKTHVSFGWVLFQSHSFFLYPSIGVGAMGSTLTWYDHHRETNQFIKAKAPSLDLALHADYFLSQALLEDGFANVTIVGLTAGYTRSISRAQWFRDTGEERGTVSPGQLQGWYVTLSVGGLALMKPKTH